MFPRSQGLKDVIEFLCRAEQTGLAIDSTNPAIADEEIQQVVEFVNGQRFCPAFQVVRCGRGHQLPLQPNFTLKRRTLRWFRRHYANWRNEVEMPVEQSKLRHACVWKATGLAGFSVNMDGFTWSMEELLSSTELQVEGGIMQHCVGTYARRCLRGASSIWSMRVMQGEQKKRVLTVEICPVNKRVIQATGKRNADPTTAAYRMLKRWAANQNVEMNLLNFVTVHGTWSAFAKNALRGLISTRQMPFNQSRRFSVSHDLI